MFLHPFDKVFIASLFLLHAYVTYAVLDHMLKKYKKKK